MRSAFTDPDNCPGYRHPIALRESDFIRDPNLPREFQTEVPGGASEYADLASR